MLVLRSPLDGVADTLAWIRFAQGNALPRVLVDSVGLMLTIAAVGAAQTAATVASGRCSSSAASRPCTGSATLW